MLNIIDLKSVYLRKNSIYVELNDFLIHKCENTTLLHDLSENKTWQIENSDSGDLRSLECTNPRCHISFLVHVYINYSTPKAVKNVIYCRGCQLFYIFKYPSSFISIKGDYEIKIKNKVILRRI